MFVIAIARIVLVFLLSYRLRRLLPLNRTVDDLIQFTSVEPYTPAFGAIVDFNALSVRHYKFGIINRAFHGTFTPVAFSSSFQRSYSKIEASADHD